MSELRGIRSQEESEKEYGKDAPLTVSHGRRHNYLGMVLDYSTKVAFHITMFDFRKNMLDELPPVMDGGVKYTSSTTPPF